MLCKRGSGLYKTYQKNHKKMKYSIITINFNNSCGLRHTIESIINQTFKDYEFIIIDGGSNDGSVDIIKEYQDHISFWVSEKDNGIYHAMNKGVKVSHGEYLLFINSGDMLYDMNVLENILPYLKADIVHGIAENINSPVSPLCLVKISNREEPFSPTLHHQACLFRKELFNNSLYDENYKIVSDWKFYIEQIMIHNCSFIFINVKVALCEGGGISETQNLLSINERIDVVNEIVNYLKEKKKHNVNKELLLHIMFTSKQRLIIDKEIRNIDRYISTFPESNNCYKQYPFTKKQKLLFFLAKHRMRFLLKILL